ncbi:hypothetical protein BYT27DRAFT_7261032 [Phlegmacium glaucopus]|nr:hypothetical protein BYT27DRAFT_7261032 [Phlegmacium glaucopus]
MASTSMRTRLFTDESLSLRSFRVNAPPSSLKASSLKLPRPLSFSTRFKSSRRVIEPTIQDLISHPSNEDIIYFDMALPPTSSEVQEPPKSSSSNAHQPWSKPRTIMRMLTTKFNPRLPTPSTLASRLTTIPPGPNAFTKENREAALRERGLLPPLEPNKDLSAQEKEQDRAIPIVNPTGDPHSPTEANNTLSAADLIKKEWEAKNRSLEYTQLQRMNSFKFGGSSSVPGSPKYFPPESADPAALDFTALPTPDPQPSRQAEIAAPQASYTQASSLTVPLVPPSTVPISKPSSRPVSPLLDIPPELAAYLFPLPPSPRSVSGPNLDSCSPPLSPTSVPLPPSPSVRSVFDTTSLRNASGVCTPKPLDIRETSLTPTPTPPIIALTPCASNSVSVNDATTSSLHKETEVSSPLDESASFQTPSLDSNSHTTTDSTLGTSESIAISGRGRFGGLKIKSHEGSNVIPVIVESPIEDSFLEEQDVVAEVIFDGTQGVTAPISGNETKFSLSTPLMKRRVWTDPTNGGLDRKKSMVMNPFRRGNSANGDHSITPPGEFPRRLSVKASLSNMRRSVVGTLSRKLTVENSGGGKKFDASHLPPSPVLPLAFGNSRSSYTSPSVRMEEGGESLPMRRAVSPMLYSRGHILMEASHIEDEESRRVTEMAFLT